MASLLDRTFDRWADENRLGRGRNAARFALLMIGSGVCVIAGVWLSTSPVIAGSIGTSGAAAAALVPLVTALGMLILAACALIMSLMNMLRTGKLG